MIKKNVAALAAALVLAASVLPLSAFAKADDSSSDSSSYSDTSSGDDSSSSTDSQASNESSPDGTADDNFSSSSESDSSSSADSSSESDSSSVPEPVLKNISSAKISSIPDQEYTAKRITPSFTVTLGGVKLVKGVDYTVAYSSNINVGRAVVTITGIGGYNGTVKTYFNIVMPVQAAVSSIKASSVTETSYTIKWSAAANADGYELYRYNVSSQNWDLLKSANVLSYKVTGLSPAQDNHYCIRAYRKIGSKTIYSEYTRLQAGTKPAAVTGLKITGATTTGYTLKWNAVSGAQKYQVYIYNASSGNFVYYKTVTTNSATVTGRKAGQKNTFQVRAVHTVNGKILYGEYQKKRFTSKPAQVTGFSVQKSGNKYLTFKWNAVANANKYQLYYSTSKNGKYTLFKEVSAKSTSVKTSLVPAGQKLYFKMRAVSKVDSCTQYGKCSSIIEGFTLNSKSINTILNSYTNSLSVTQVNAQGYTLSDYNKNRLYTQLTNLGGSAGYILYDIDSGSVVAYNANSYFGTASTVKMPYILYCLREMEDGDPSMDTLLTYMPSDYSSGSSWIKNQPFYTTYTIKRVMELIGDYSDNCGYYMLQDYFGYSGYNSFISSLGCRTSVNSSIRWGYVSACDSAREWNNMWNYMKTGKYADFAKDVFSTSCAANIRNQLGNRYTVYEKSGWTETLYNETALVNAKHPYIVICLSNRTSAQRMRNVAEISEAIHNEMWNYYE